MTYQLTHILFAYLAQAIGAVIMAFLLLYFYRVFRRSYLLHWAWSWGAFSLYLIGAVIGFSVTGLYQPAHPLRWGVTIVALTGGYLQAFWLLLGTYEITVGKTLSKRFVRNVIILLCSLAIVTTFGFITDPDARMIRFFLRIGIRSLLVGAGFIYAAIGILRLGFARIAIGQRLVAGVFLIYGLEQLQYFFSAFADLFGFGTLLPYANLLGILDLLMHTLMGMGMIIWLLEDERQVEVKTSESLRESESKLERFRAILDQAKEAIFVIDPETGGFLDVNETAVHITGYTRKELLALSVKDIEIEAPVTSPEQWRSHIEQLKTEKSLVLMEGAHRRKDGSTYPVEASISYKDFKGQPYLLVITRDITERKRTEELIFNIAKGVSAATGDTFFRSLVKHLAVALNADYAFIGVYQKEPVEKVTTIAVYADGEMANNVTYDLAGSPFENVVGRQLCCYPDRVQQLFPRDHLLVEMEIEAYAGAPLFDSTGKVLGLLVVLCRQPLEHPEVAESLLKIFAVRASAELERNQTEKTIRESEKRFRDLFEGSPDAIFVEDLEGNVLDANPAAGKLQGIDHKELFGKNIIDLVPPDQSEIAEKEFHKLVKGEIKHIEGLSRSQKGQDIPIEIHASHISYAGKPALLLLVRDISERKKAEREKQQMEAQLRQAQKLETIGRLAGGVAHDINNILTPILCYTDMAMHQLPANSESHNDLEQVIQGANRAKELVQQILLFSRQAEQERKPVRLQLIVHEALKFLRATLPATIEIRENLDDDCQAVLADPSQMHQVVMNLCTNAYDAMRENGGCMEISLEAVYVDTGLKRKLPNLQTGRYVRLMVKDNGQGIQSNALEHIFEPFYTTKPVRRGTGLGLSVVHGIVMSHGGEIEVCSEPGTGASFRIYLPAIAAPDLPPIREVHVPVGGKERILFVDDEKEIVKIGKRMLEAFGYRVTTCSNGSEALQVFRAQPRHFDLIISDQTMPELTGLKLATEIKRIRADMPIILTTGYSEEATPELLDKIGVQTCVMKPFKADDIARAIRQALHPQNHPTKK